MDVSTSGVKGGWEASSRLTMVSEDEQVIVKVVTTIQRDTSSDLATERDVGGLVTRVNSNCCFNAIRLKNPRQRELSTWKKASDSWRLMRLASSEAKAEELTGMLAARARWMAEEVSCKRR